ncbi:hypothetical protein ES703_33415 [subsurface metagenome]
MAYPPLVRYASEQEYRRHFIEKYCKRQIITFDDIPVRFNNKDFAHAFYESGSNLKNNLFSVVRAQRIDWIEVALLDANAELYYGWDADKKRVDTTRRVALVKKNYIVIIQIMKSGKARFITAFVANNYRTFLKIKQSPKWQ